MSDINGFYVTGKEWWIGLLKIVDCIRAIKEYIKRKQKETCHNNKSIKRLKNVESKNGNKNDYIGSLFEIIIIINMSCWKHNLEPILENERPQILWDFEMQTDHLIPARRPDRVRVKKKRKKERENMPNKGLSRFGWPRSENQDKYLNPARVLKKLWNTTLTVILIVIGELGTISKR